MPVRPLDPDALRYARYWEPVLAPAAHRVLDRITQPPSVLLDLGVGTGSLTLEAAARWPKAHLIAVDASGAMLAVARARAAKHRDGDSARIDWIPADARDLPLDDDSVDVAVSSFVLQRIEERPSLLAEVLRVLRPGGSFVFVTWLADELTVTADTSYAEILAELGHESDEAGFRSPLATDYTSLDEARHELSEAGFAQVDIWPDELHAQWTPATYLELKEQHDDHERFDALDGLARERLRARLLQRWAGLPAAAFEVRSPLLAGFARKAAMH